MNKLLFVCLLFILSCKTNIQGQKAVASKPEILMSESQGGTDTKGFVIIKDQKHLVEEVSKRSGITDAENKPSYPTFTGKNKWVIYDLGSFNSGDHRITEIKNITVKNNVLTLEVLKYESGGMEIMMISKPWILFSVPLDYRFNAIEITYSK